MTKNFLRFVVLTLVIMMTMTLTVSTLGLCEEPYERVAAFVEKHVETFSSRGIEANPIKMQFSQNRGYVTINDVMGSGRKEITRIENGEYLWVSQFISAKPSGGNCYARVMTEDGIIGYVELSMNISSILTKNHSYYEVVAEGEDKGKVIYSIGEMLTTNGIAILDEEFNAYYAHELRLVSKMDNSINYPKLAITDELIGKYDVGELKPLVMRLKISPSRQLYDVETEAKVSRTLKDKTRYYVTEVYYSGSYLMGNIMFEDGSMYMTYIDSDVKDAYKKIVLPGHEPLTFETTVLDEEGNETTKIFSTKHYMLLENGWAVMDDEGNVYDMSSLKFSNSELEDLWI